MTDGLPPVECVSQFERFSGATIEWDVLLANFMGLLLTARLDGELIAELQFSYPTYLECPLRMTNVRLRMATPEEQGRLPAGVPKRHFWAPERAHLVIEAEEGVFSICAAYLTIYDPSEQAEIASLRRIYWSEVFWPSPFD